MPTFMKIQNSREKKCLKDKLYHLRTTKCIVFGSVANSFRCAFLRGIECFYRRKISDFAEATREKRFTTMTPLGMSRDVMCHRL